MCSLYQGLINSLLSHFRQLITAKIGRLRLNSSNQTTVSYILHSHKKLTEEHQQLSSEHQQLATYSQLYQGPPSKRSQPKWSIGPGELAIQFMRQDSDQRPYMATVGRQL